MNNPLLMGVLNGLANLAEQLQSLRDRQSLPVAIIRDPLPSDQFHHEIGSTFGSSASLENACNARMIHEGQRLLFRFKTGDDAFGIQSELDQFDGDLAPNRG